MIAHIRGKVIHKEPGSVVLECGGVGYSVTLSVRSYTSLPEAGAEAALFIHTHVREDALALFGFIKLQEKHLFERLIAVSGIGPKLGMQILSGMESDALIAAIRGNDLAALTKMNGVGKKTAERMVLELRDKLDAFSSTPLAKAASASPLDEDVLSGLANLGYSRNVSEKALAVAKLGGGKDFDTLFRASLGIVSK